MMIFILCEYYAPLEPASLGTRHTTNLAPPPASNLTQPAILALMRTRIALKMKMGIRTRMALTLEKNDFRVLKGGKGDKRYPSKVILIWAYMY